MNNVWKWIFGFVVTLFTIMVIYSVVIWQKYNKLESDYLLLTTSTNTLVEALYTDNENKQIIIDQLQSEVKLLEDNIKSLKKIEKKFESKETIFIGKTLSESTIVLKKNLCEE